MTTKKKSVARRDTTGNATSSRTASANKKAMALDRFQVKEITKRRATTEHNLGMAIEDWRLKKRAEWRQVMNALSLFTFGCAYTPAGMDLYELQRAADRINETLQADWVCW